jgi:catechol 2,3-dioxygenase-like lactoylglutathione lyase family enzyme
MKVSLVSLPVQDPLIAHDFYTKTLGFISIEFKPEEQLAIVASKEDPDGTMILLEPCLGSFAESYQRSVYEANLPVIVFAVEDTAKELSRLEKAGVKLRPELDNPEWGLGNMFEDGCGNIIMIEVRK